MARFATWNFQIRGLNTTHPAAPFGKKERIGAAEVRRGDATTVHRVST